MGEIWPVGSGGCCTARKNAVVVCVNDGKKKDLLSGVEGHLRQDI